ncbi:MAG: molybdopterin-guanine dinucleotide biosynthesis protein B [Candidatus Brocadiia bacterium]
MSVPPIVCIVGRKGAGKTTLIERLVPELRRLGYAVGTAKRPPHAFHFDVPGKDSYRHFHAGAEATVVYGHGVVAAVRRLPAETPLEALVARFLPEVDIVLAEGHKSAPLPKLEVFRAEVHPSPLYEGQPDYVAIASDEPLEAGIPRLDLADPAAIAAFLVARLLPPGPGRDEPRARRE